MARSILVFNFGSYRFMLILVVDVADANFHVVGSWIRNFLETQKTFLTP